MKHIIYSLIAVVMAVILISSAAHFGSYIEHQRSVALITGSISQKSNIENQTDDKNSRPIFQFKQTLKLGDDSPNVLALQMFLNEEGFFVTEKETTYFGQLTRNAILRYQESRNLAVTGDFDQVTLDTVNKELQVQSVQNLAGSRCSQYGVNEKAEVLFPRSPITPPLPAPDTRPYVPHEYDCDNFAMSFCERLKAINPDVDCSTLIFDTHMINVFEYTDAHGVKWVCVVEPQGNKFYCMTKEKWDKLPGGWKKWVEDELCSIYYLYTPEECKGWISTQKYLGACSDVIGTPCQEGVKPGFCSDPSFIPGRRWGENKGFKSILCYCDIVNGQFTNCKWKHYQPRLDPWDLDQPSTTTPPVGPSTTPQKVRSGTGNTVQPSEVQGIIDSFQVVH